MVAAGAAEAGVVVATIAAAAAGAEAMVTTVDPWSSVPVAGGTLTASASAGIDDYAIAVTLTRDRRSELGVPGNRHAFLILRRFEIAVAP